MAVIFAMGITTSQAQTETESKAAITATTTATNSSFGVRGNCGMCKKTIEKAANGVEGVSSATWDKDKKKIDVTFDGKKTDAMAIQKAIAASGYDTEDVAGDLTAYKGLPGCCKYDHEMEMNQSGE